MPEGVQPYDWEAATGLARRFIPGQPRGMHASSSGGLNGLLIRSTMPTDSATAIRKAFMSWSVISVCYLVVIGALFQLLAPA